MKKIIARLKLLKLNRIYSSIIADCCLQNGYAAEVHISPIVKQLRMTSEVSLLKGIDLAMKYSGTAEILCVEVENKHLELIKTYISTFHKAVKVFTSDSTVEFSDNGKVLSVTNY